MEALHKNSPPPPPRDDNARDRLILLGLSDRDPPLPKALSEYDARWLLLGLLGPSWPPVCAQEVEALDSIEACRRAQRRRLHATWMDLGRPPDLGEVWVRSREIADLRLRLVSEFCGFLCSEL